MSTGNFKIVPNFMTARSPMGLRRLMLSNNIKNGKQFHYFDIAYIPTSKKWICWYEDEIKIEIKVDNNGLDAVTE